MNQTESNYFESLQDALKYMKFASGMAIDETHVVLAPTMPAALGILPLVLGFIGLLFNILALLIFTASKTFRENSFRCYIYAFVLVNCASILAHSWFYLIFYVTDPYEFCKYLQYLQHSTITTSLWIMVLLSFERSFTFTRPFIVKKLIHPRTIYFILFLVACFCFLAHIDEIISVDITAFRWVNFGYASCSVYRHSRFSAVRMKIITHSHSFILPFLFNTILDIYICCKIFQRRRRLQNKSNLLTQTNSNRKAHQRSKVSLANEITLTLLCQSMWLLVTYFPRHLYYFLIQFNIINDHDRDNSTLTFIMRINLLFCLAFSPTLYVILSPTLRKEIRLYICSSYKRHPPINLSNLSNAQDKIRHFLHYQHQKHLHPSNHSRILATASEQLPRKSPSQSIYLFANNKHLSKSEPCLILYQHENQFDERRRTERSNTIHV